MNKLYDKMVDSTFSRIRAVISKYRDNPSMNPHLALLEQHGRAVGMVY